ncbi:hypothetical protein Tco_0493256 [Tanacetum coccineum]
MKIPFRLRELIECRGETPVYAAIGGGCCRRDSPVIRVTRMSRSKMGAGEGEEGRRDREGGWEGVGTRDGRGGGVGSGKRSGNGTEAEVWITGGGREKRDVREGGGEAELASKECGGDRRGTERGRISEGRVLGGNGRGTEKSRASSNRRGKKVWRDGWVVRDPERRRKGKERRCGCEVGDRWGRTTDGGEFGKIEKDVRRKSKERRETRARAVRMRRDSNEPKVGEGRHSDTVGAERGGGRMKWRKNKNQAESDMEGMELGQEKG